MTASATDKRQQAVAPVCALLILSAGTIPAASPTSLFWTAPGILAAAMLIAWAAESAQFFMAQGFALAILAWLQTLPEFAVEAVLAWKQQVPLLMANLTGALRLLTGLGWPMIYFTAAGFHRKRTGKNLGPVRLKDEHCVEIIGLAASMAYMVVVWWKGSLGLWDAGVLIAVYVAYLLLLTRMPPEEAETIDELERIPRAIVLAPKGVRIAAIAGLFLAGGALIYFMAEPFLASLLALSTSLGVPSFVFVQWVAPLVSEFPEKVSAFYWARTVERASTALMNMVSSNVNQWTLLAAMLPITYSLSRGAVSSIPLDGVQELELVLTLAQGLLGLLFLMEMKLEWWEAAGLFVLWAVQFVFSATGLNVHLYVTAAYLVWSALELIRMASRRRAPEAIRLFGIMWTRHFSRVR
jgi:cation:H+ antiporter